MKIGIIVYSQTGNTLSVAQRLEKALSVKGHTAEIVRVEISDSVTKRPAPVSLKASPDISRFDGLIFASPVHAFSLAPAMKLYLSQLQSLSGKSVCCFVTMGLKKAWMGGNSSVRQFKARCGAKGANIIESGIVIWSSPEREKQIEDTVKKIASAM
jgi:flavodoxin